MRNVSIVVLCGSMMVLMALTSQAQLIIAHRGASHDAPENTLAAFKLAWEQKADGIEGDFYLTRDGKIICTHDKTTKRTAKGGVDLDVASSTLADLRKLDVGSWKDPKYAGEKMPTLEEVLAIIPAGKLFFIEIKCGPEILPALEKTLAHLPVPAENLRIISFNADVIAQSKDRLPKIKAQWLTDYKQDKQSGEWRPGHEAVLKMLKDKKAAGLGSKANFVVLTPEFVNQLKGIGLEVGAWTVDKAEDARKLRDMGVSAITTNRPGFIRDALK
jgi:glycerophosphoryl diester phosphodiesterase